MANLTEESQWSAGIYQIELTDPVLGGPPDLPQGKGIANVAAKQLADRTKFLKDFVEQLEGRLNTPVIQESAGTGNLAMSAFQWVTVPNGQLTVAQAGKYQVTATFRMLAVSGYESMIEHWEARIIKNGAEQRWIFGLNADETGFSNQDATSTALVFLDLDENDVLAHQFAAKVSATITSTYTVTFDIIRIGEKS